MMPAATIPTSASLLMQLASSAVRALILAAGVGVALNACRVKAVSLRLQTWTAILFAALLMPLLGWMLPPISVAAPAFLHNVIAPSSATLARQTASEPTPAVTEHQTTTLGAPVNKLTHHPQSTIVTLTPAARPDFPNSVWPRFQWSIAAAGVYLAVALLLLTRLVVGMVFTRRLVRGARQICDPQVSMRLALRSRECGLRQVPAIAESELISVPMTAGAVRPSILLPVDWRLWDDNTLGAVLSHELSHIVRRDALTQRLSLLHRAIFWFSPLAWWLDRHLAELAEQASDEAALSSGADRSEYATALLGFFESLQLASGRVRWQGVSMAQAGRTEKRLERILNWRGAAPMRLKKPLLVAIVAFSIPAVYLVASVRPDSRAGSQAQSQTPPAAPSAAPVTAGPTSASSPAEPPDSTLAPAAPVNLMTPPAAIAPGIGLPSKNGHTLIVPSAPISGISTVPPIAPIAPQSSHHGRGYSYAYGDDDEQRFVIVSGKTDALTMSGTGQDARHVERLRKQIGGDFIWFQRDEKSYIIRDQATIDRARKLWAPQEELGKKQEELGKQQEELGRQQEELGKKMEEVRVNVPDMTAELDKLKAKLQKLGPKATMDQIGDLQSEIGELQSKMGEIQSQAGEQQGKLGEEMGALGEKQGKLGEKQGELGRQQGELAEQASRQMKELLDEALKKGTAQPEPQSGGGTL